MEEKNDDINVSLIKAIEDDNLQEVQFLLEKGADLNVKDEFGNPALSRSLLHSSNEIIELLINKGADVNAKDEYGNTPLIYAADNDTKAIAELLIIKGAEVNGTFEDGFTPLMIASESGTLEIVELLLKKGAGLNEKDEDGQTALMMAVENRQDETVELLINNGANINLRNNDGWSALMYATDYGCKEIAELLIKKGADINIKDNKGASILDIAKNNRYSGVADLLEKSKKHSISMINHSNGVYKLINGEKGWKTYFENPAGNWPVNSINYIRGCIFFLIAISTMIYLILPANFTAGRVTITELFIANLIPNCVIALVLLLSILLMLKIIFTLYLDAKSESRFYRGQVDEIKGNASKGNSYILKSGKLKWVVSSPLNIRMSKGDLIITEYKPYTPILIKLMVKHKKI